MVKRALVGLGVAALVILAAGGGFLYGRSVGAALPSRAAPQFVRERPGGVGSALPGAFQAGQTGQEGGLGLRGAFVGAVEAIEGDTLVVNTQEGILRVRITETTLIEKYMSVTAAELEPGEQLTISGSRNEDGSVTARSIQTLRGAQFTRPDQP